MQFILSRTELLNNLQAVKAIIQSKNTNPILDNFLFDIDNGKLTLYGSTGDTTLQASMPIETPDNALFAVPADNLVETLKNLPEQPLSFRLEGHQLHINAENGKYSLPVYPGEEYPKPPAIEDAFVSEIQGSQLSDALAKTVFAVGNDEMRPVLNGILFHFKPGELSLVSTDSHKLVKFSIKGIEGEGQEYIFPQKPAQIIKNLTAGTEENVKMRFTERAAEFVFGNYVLTTTLIVGKFPNYELVIPKDNPLSLIINRDLFLQSLKRTSIYASKTTHLILLEFEGSKMTIYGRNEEVSSEAVETLTVNYQGEPIKIGFNARSLIEMLSHLDSEEVQMTMSAPNRAVLLTPMDGVADNEEIIMLLMPIAF